MSKDFLNSSLNVLIIAILLRLAVWFIALSGGEGYFLTTDSYDYLAVAHNILEYGEYSSSESAPFYPEVFRTPGYPGFLSLFLWLGSSVPVISLMQVILSSITVLLVMKCVRLFLPQRSRLALFSGWLMALDIPSALFSVSILSETLFTFLFVLALFLLLRFFQTKDHRDLLLMSLALGIAVWVRPIILYFPLFLAFLLFQQKLRTWKVYVSATLPFLFFIFFWMGLNFQRTGSLFFTCLDEFNLAWFQAADILAEKKDLHINEARTVLFEEAHKNLGVDPQAHPVEFYHELKKVSLQVLANYPFSFLKNAFWAEVNLFLRPAVGHLRHTLGETDLNSTVPSSQSYSVLFWVLLAFQFFHLALIYLGVLFSFLGRWSIISLPGIILLYFMIPGTGPEMEARFRIPLLVVLLLLSMAGYSRLLEKRSSRANS